MNLRISQFPQWAGLRVVTAALLFSAPTLLQSAPAGEPVPEAFQPLRLGEVKPQGWLRAQLERDLKTGFQGNLDILLEHRGDYILQETNNDYLTRARNAKARHDAQGRTIPPAPQAWWDAEMVGDWYDGLIRAAFLVNDARAREKCDRFIDAMLKSQDDDGYIGIYPKGYRFHFASADGELWTQRCAFLAMLSYYEFTGRKDVLESVERAVALTLSQYGPNDNYFDNPKQPNAGVSHGLLLVDVLEWLHRITGKNLYRESAVRLYEDYSNSQLVANKAAQLSKLLDKDAPLGGHGPDIMGFLRVPLMAYYFSGNADYKAAWENSILKLNRHIGVGGSPLSGNKEEIMRDNQRPGMPYEYCSTFYLLHTLTWAMQKTGEQRYADMLEKTLFNAAQGARFSDGKALTYYSADERLWVRQKPPEGEGNHRYIYTPAFYPSCCHNSGARSYPYAISSMWMRSTEPAREGLVLCMYGPSTVSTEVSEVPVQISEETKYPFSFDVALTVVPEREVSFPIRLRIPEWSAGYKVAARGAKVSKDNRGFVIVEKKWKAGDTLRLTLNPSITPHKAVDGTSAISYGPLVFALPVPAKAEIVQQFPQAEAAGLHGLDAYQFDPADLASAKRPLKWSSAERSYGLRVVADTTADPLHPWDKSPLQLRGRMIRAEGKTEKVTLVPMGCTILRRTCF